MSDINFKYNEDKIIEELLGYIKSTYAGHYVGDARDSNGDKIQTIDMWESMGSVDTTCRDTAMKYLSRYGKKEGYNKKDLLKQMHYVILLWHFTQDTENVTSSGNPLTVDTI
jgi:predicted glutamine amidotransferase